MLERTAHEAVESLPTGFDSIKGCGQVAPSSFELTPDGVLIPSGVLEPTFYADSSALTSNEMVVFNPAQLAMRYLIKVQFSFSV